MSAEDIEQARKNLGNNGPLIERAQTLALISIAESLAKLCDYITAPPVITGTDSPEQRQEQMEHIREQFGFPTKQQNIFLADDATFGNPKGRRAGAEFPFDPDLPYEVTALNDVVFVRCHGCDYPNHTPGWNMWTEKDAPEDKAAHASGDWLRRNMDVPLRKIKYNPQA